MRLSKQLCFLVAAAIASAVDGAPIGAKLQRRQAITLELTPTQQIDVDGSRKVPTILISDNGYQVGQPNCIGSNCGSYSINMPPIKQMEDFMVPQTTYDPYAENYSPYPSYPPSRSNLYAAPPLQSQTINAAGPPHVSALPPPATVIPPPKWTNAGWNAPLIPSGSFSESLQGTPTVPTSVNPTSTTTAPGPVAAAVPQAQIPAPEAQTAVQPAPAAAPLPLNAPAPISGGATPATVPAPTLVPEIKDEEKTVDVKPAEAAEAAPPAGTSPPSPPAPAPQRRGLRAGKPKQVSSSTKQKRSPTTKRLQKRQLELVETPAALNSYQKDIVCEPNKIEKVEVLVPVTEEELTALQDGSAEIVSYPSIAADGTEEKLYDILPITSEPTISVPTLKNIYEEGTQKVSEENPLLHETRATSGKAPEERSLFEESEQIPRPRSLNAGSQDAPNFTALEKRLKHGSNGLNSSMVGNGAGKTKYGFTIHDNKNGASSISPIGVCTATALAVIFGVYATLL